MVALEGLRVVRGPDWKWGDQDGGEGCVGTVVSGKCGGSHEMREKLNSLRAEITTAGLENDEELKMLDRMAEGMVELREQMAELGELSGKVRRKQQGETDESSEITVCWDSGHVNNYRVGTDGFFDLRVLDYATLGRKHPGIPCGVPSCKVEEIFGFRWQCSQCHTNLCTKCFLQVDKRHDVAHTAFQRFDSPDAQPVSISLNNGKIPLHGIFRGAEVKRGPDWKYGNEDEGGCGVVVPTMGSPVAGKVYVQWKENSSICLYRRGAEGKMDLKATVASLGGYYHPDWLPVLKVDDSGESVSVANRKFLEGDKVRIKADIELEELRSKQANCGEWEPSLKQMIGKLGTVSRVDKKDEIYVEYVGFDKKWQVNPAVLEWLSPFSIGQVVRVKGNSASADCMALVPNSSAPSDSIIGDIGKVEKIDDDGTVHVNLAITNSVISLGPEFIEALPLSAHLHEKMSKMKRKLAGLAVQGAAEGDLYIVHEVFTFTKLEIDTGDPSRDSMTALHAACRKGRINIVHWLLDRGGDVEKPDDKGRRAIHHAVEACQPQVLKLLISKGALVDSLMTEKFFTPLQIAMMKQYTECAKILIDNKCDVNLQDSDGDTPLHNDAYRKRSQMVLFGGNTRVPEIVDLIVESGRANLSLRNNKGLNVMHVAAGVGNLCMVKYLLENGYGQLAFEVDLENKVSTLHIACLKGHYEIAKFIVEFVKENADEFPQASTSSKDDFDRPEKRLTDARDKNGVTPLMLSCHREDCALIELLVYNGADVNATDKDGDTPIIFLSIRMRKEKKRTVPNAEKSPAIRKCYDENVGQEAMRENPLLAAFCFLIQNQGRLAAVNKMGRTALNIIDDPIVISFLDGFYLPFKLSMASVETMESNGMEDIIVDNCSVDAGYCILCPNPLAFPYVFQPCGHSVMACPTCGPFLQRCSSCNCVPSNRQSLDYIKVIDQDEAIQFQKGFDEVVQRQASMDGDAANGYKWEIEPKGSRKGFDLLHDGTGNTYSKRPSSGKGVTMWQCTKKSDTGTNKCPVTVKQLLNTFVHLNLPHKHCKFAL